MNAPAAEPFPPALPGFGPYLSPESRRRWAVRALTAILFLLTVEVLWKVVGVASVGRLVEVPDQAWFAAYDRVTTGLDLAEPALLVVAAVAFVAWQRLAIRNTMFLGCERPDPGATLATFGWFVPFLNLVLPYLSLRQVAVWSRPPGSRGGPLLGLWWGAWLLSGPVATVGAVLTTLDTGPNLWVAGIAVQAVGRLLLVASGVLAIRIVNALSRGQEARVAAMATPSPVPAAATPDAEASPRPLPAG